MAKFSLWSIYLILLNAKNTWFEHFSVSIIWKLVKWYVVTYQLAGFYMVETLVLNRLKYPYRFLLWSLPLFFSGVPSVCFCCCLERKTKIHGWNHIIALERESCFNVKADIPTSISLFKVSNGITRAMCLKLVSAIFHYF